MQCVCTSYSRACELKMERIKHKNIIDLVVKNIK